MKKIQYCATNVVLISLAMVVIYQMLQGHQYFIARREYNNKINSDEPEDDKEPLLTADKQIDQKENELDQQEKQEEDSMNMFENSDPGYLL